MNTIRWKRLTVVLAVLVLLAGALVGWFAFKRIGSARMIYQNPVFEPVLADPSVIRGQDGKFYAYGTEDDWGDGQGSRLVPVVRSNDLVRWEVVGNAFSKKPAWRDNGGIWAPDISFMNGKYYLYYAMSVWGDSNPGIGVAVSDRPEGPFEDKGKLFDSVDIGVSNSIDPMHFTDDDGKSYLFWGSFHGIYGIELSSDGFKTAGEPFQIAGPTFEAAYLIKRDGQYYFLGSMGSCCEGEFSGYSVAVGRSDKLKGPYRDKEGGDLKSSNGTLILTGSFAGQNTGKSFAGPGHTAVIRDDAGTDWLVYHAVDKANPRLNNNATRRPLMIDPLVWNDGWPAIEGLTPSTSGKKPPIWKR